MKPSPTYPVPTKQATSARHHLSWQRQNPETWLVHDRRIHEHGGCHHAQADLLNGHHRYSFCCCSITCVVAFGYAVASDHCLIVDQPHRDDGGLQGSAPNRRMGRHLSFSLPSSSPVSSQDWPRSCAGAFFATWNTAISEMGSASGLSAHRLAVSIQPVAEDALQLGASAVAMHRDHTLSAVQTTCHRVHGVYSTQVPNIGTEGLF